MQVFVAICCSDLLKPKIRQKWIPELSNAGILYESRTKKWVKGIVSWSTCNFFFQLNYKFSISRQIEVLVLSTTLLDRMIWYIGQGVLSSYL